MKRKKYEYIDKEDFLGYINIVEVCKVIKVVEICVGYCFIWINREVCDDVNVCDRVIVVFVRVVFLFLYLFFVIL